jgi:hypothetical protein
MCEIKYEKYTIPHRTSTAYDPAKRGIEQTSIEPTMLDFRPGADRALPAYRGRLIGFPFQERASSGARPRVRPLPLTIGGPAGKPGLSPFIH